MQPHERRQLIEQLYRRYGRGVGSYVLARVGNADVAETITSSVFLIVVQRIEQCRGSHAAWLWSIVRSEIARHFRQHRHTEPIEGLRLTDASPQPHEAASRHEMRQRMRLALDQLSEEQQRLVYLKFFQDLGNTQIAAALGLSANHVGVMVHRATRRLRESMEPKSPVAIHLASNVKQTDLESQ